MFERYLGGKFTEVGDGWDMGIKKESIDDDSEKSMKPLILP